MFKYKSFVYELNFSGFLRIVSSSKAFEQRTLAIFNINLTTVSRYFETGSLFVTAAKLLSFRYVNLNNCEDWYGAQLVVAQMRVHLANAHL